VLTLVGLAVGALVMAQELARWWVLGRSGQLPDGARPVEWVTMDNLATVLLLAVALVLSWRWPLLGAVAFLGYFAAYGIVSLAQDFPQVALVLFDLIFAAPQGLVGALLLSSWLFARHRESTAPTITTSP
jgi:hypothetical protein